MREQALKAYQQLLSCEKPVFPPVTPFQAGWNPAPA